LQSSGHNHLRKTLSWAEPNWQHYQKRVLDLVEHVRVYAVSTLKKIKIIKALQAKDQFVAWPVMV
jgi:hypothetical protein